MKFLLAKWTWKHYSFINLKGKVINLISKITRKKNHFWFVLIAKGKSKARN